MITIDYQDKRPLYEQVVEKIEQLIVKGILPENEKIPSVRSLAVELSINPNTIQRAYAVLEQNGFIYTVKGRGNYVSEMKTWIGDEKSDMLKTISADFQKAKMLGILKAEILSIVNDCYEEDKK